MFALALWDGRTRTLIAARDRAGEKPLYWTQTSRGLLLASEVKALLVRPEVSRELDPIALDQFLTYEYVLAPRTMLKGVHKLPPAHYLRYRDGEVDGASLLGCGRRRRSRSGTTTTRRRRCARRCATAVDRPDDGGRAARRVSLRRHRLELHRRAS